MNVEIPTLLVFLGAALMAVAIFAPKRRPAESLAGAAGPAFNAWHTLPEPEVQAPGYADDFAPPLLAALPVVTWPALVDPRAVSLDATARVALAEALAALREPWADAIVRRALAEETDGSVRMALEAAIV